MAGGGEAFQASDAGSVAGCGLGVADVGAGGHGVSVARLWLRSVAGNRGSSRFGVRR